ncbi:MAG: Fic family protein [Mucilaginibacter sp.]
MNLKLEKEFSKADILKEIDTLKKQIDDMRPLAADVEGRVMQKLRLDWNYHSNAIEGNKLSYGETVAFLMEGITAKGKPLKDHLDIRGHNEAILFLTSLVKDSRPISESEIRSLHKMILVEPYEVKAQTAEGQSTTKQIALGEYKKSPNHVKTATGELHYYASPEETPAKMQELMEWYIEATNSKIHPVVIAALFHHKFVAIHPFDDGNGRLSRILMNLILMQAGYPPVVIKMDDRQNYYSLLSRADNNDNWPFVEYVAERVVSSLQLYLKAAMGGDIDEDDDIDKEIALFKMDIFSKTNLKERKTIAKLEDILKNQITPLANKLKNKVQGFEDIFFDKNYTFDFDIGDFGDDVYDSLEEFFSPRSFPFETPEQWPTVLDKTQSLKIRFTFKNFKNSSHDFSVSNYVKIIFNEYDLQYLNIDDNVILNKLYHEKLTVVDQQKIIKVLIEDIKNNITNELKSPKSK